MTDLARKTGRKNRKHGRNKHKCLAYRNSRTRERNKARKLAKRLKNHPNDGCVKGALGAP